MKLIARVVLFWTAVLALLGLTVFTYFARRERADDLELLRIGLEDAVGRVRMMSDNLKLVRKYSDEAILAKTRAYAQIIAADPSIITNQARMEALARKLDVDELHVSDEKGVLIAGVPTIHLGFDMSTTDQTRPFMAALTDKNFELAQDPMPKGDTQHSDDSLLFQYAGVARIDKPGLVEIGQRASRIEQAQKMADVKDLERTMRIGRYGRVSIRPAKDLPAAEKGFRDEVGRNGRRLIVLESDCAGYRIRVWMPKRHLHLAHPNAFGVMLAVDLLAFVLFGGLMGRFRRVFAHDLRATRAMFAGTSNRAIFRMARSPVAVACVAGFAFAIAACWGVSARIARANAEDMLRASAQDMRETFDASVDLLLFYQGNAICQHYKSPENMSGETVQSVMRRYALDELNVVNSEGKIVIGALADVGYDMGSKPQTAAFNCLLHGAKTYSQPFRGAVEDPTLRRKYAGVAFPPPARGYLQLGFAEERLKDDVDYWFADQANDWHIGETGFYVIAKDETGVIDSCGHEVDGQPACQGGETLAGIGFDATCAPKDPNEFFVANLFGTDCLCLTEIRAFHRIVTAMPLAEVNGNSTRIVLVTAAVLIVVLAIVVIFMTRLSEVVEKLKLFIAADKERRLKDLSLAKTIQISSLPVMFSPEEDYSIYTRMVTARDVGGDFYDFYPLPNGKIVFLIADVSGKGVPAALFMMRAKALIRSAIVESATDLARAVEIANNYLSNNNEAEMFVTAWVATYDRASGVVEYVNAGHNPPLIRRANGSVEWLRDRGGLVLAAMGGVKYKAHTCWLDRGDTIFLYTDGVSEAMNTANEQFGETRLEAALRKSGGYPVEDVGKAVSAFTVGAEQSDDITMLALERRLTYSPAEMPDLG